MEAVIWMRWLRSWQARRAKPTRHRPVTNRIQEPSGLGAALRFARRLRCPDLRLRLLPTPTDVEPGTRSLRP
eukprot:2285313-Alexandrium_andersonii.AAC.1